MPLIPLTSLPSSLRYLIQKWRPRTATSPGPALSSRVLDVVRKTWDLGFTAFGGPPVHFQILHARFVDREKCVDEETYQELFAVCQGLPGPASTKMLFCLTLLRAGFIPAVVVFMLWCLLGAIGMYAPSLGVQHIDDTLPAAVYALLSGLNASTVGIIALAAVQLAEKAVRDKLSRLLVIFGACAGLCYSALWYFPLLMVVEGFVTTAWDGWGARWVRGVKRWWRERELEEGNRDGDEAVDLERVGVRTVADREMPRLRRPAGSTDLDSNPLANVLAGSANTPSLNPAQDQGHVVRVQIGAAILVSFFASFITILTIRARLSSPPLPLSLFSNMYLAGTVIFGGGPVVIPLLRSYVVDPNWVSSRDFLIGLAIIQSFPGPNFNFAVFLGALTLSASHHSVLGAILSGFAIFSPGLILAVAVQSFWRVLRRKMYVVHFLRGVNAAAVGLVFTAVYRLWEIGYLQPGGTSEKGVSLAREPWWVIVAAVSYSGSRWFGVPPAVAIVAGAALGVAWWRVVGGE
ncbi:chromate transporter-domain-containing protein [Aspergillus foveolatus]|uniref:chromate transporter-domain-containing protein n=1 Tax=Aspergillus foveolatus TaxID=210207 RepID=UPI003CCDE010